MSYKGVDYWLVRKYGNEYIQIAVQSHMHSNKDIFISIFSVQFFFNFKLYSISVHKINNIHICGRSVIIVSYILITYIYIK